MIYLVGMEAQGFASLIQPFKFKLNQPGLNVIQAENGVGKTTIISCVYWIAYGKSLKGNSSVETWKKYRPKDYAGVYGKLSFKKDKTKYEIIRCKDFKNDVLGAKGNSRLILLINGEDFCKLHSKENRDKPDVQAEILKILGMSATLFKNSVIFGQKLKRIIDETGPTKKEVFEEAFEAGYINKGLDKAKKLLIAKKSDWTHTGNQLTLATEKLEALKSKKEILKNFEQDKADRIADITKGLEKRRKALSELKRPLFSNENLSLEKDNLKYEQEKLAKLEELDRKAFKMDLELNGQERALQNKETTLAAKKQAVKDIKSRCNACGQKIDEKLRAQQRKELMAEIEKLRIEITEDKLVIEKTKIVHSGYQKQLSSKNQIKDNITLLSNTIQKLEKVKDKVKAFKTEVETLTKQIEYDEGLIAKENQRNIDINYDEIQNGIRTIKTEVAPLKVAYKSIRRDVRNLEWAITNPLSNKGLKAFIFNSMLGSINQRLEYYSKYLKFKVEFGIDLQSARKDFYTVIYRDDQICNYDDLSGGQQQLTSIALAFAIHDTLNDNPEKAFNCLWLDEIFESLDVKNTDIVADLIQAKAADKCVYLITHNKEFNVSNANIIALAQVAGNTYLQ